MDEINWNYGIEKRNIFSDESKGLCKGLSSNRKKTSRITEL